MDVFALSERRSRLVHDQCHLLHVCLDVFYLDGAADLVACDLLEYAWDASILDRAGHPADWPDLSA